MTQKRPWTTERMNTAITRIIEGLDTTTDIALQLGESPRGLIEEMGRRGMAGPMRVAAIAAYAIDHDLVDMDSDLGLALEDWLERRMKERGWKELLR